MKAVPKVNTDGLFLEDTLVDDAFDGVVPFYADPPAPVLGFLPETDSEADDQPEERAEPEIAGYIVAVPVPSGFFRPRFNLAAWQTYQDAVAAAQEKYRAASAEWSVQSEDERREPPVYVAPEQPQLWGEGLTPEEIEELTRSNPQNPSSTDLLGAELTSMKLQNIQQQQTISALGAELAAVKLDVIKLRGVEQA